jgi:hypothetical protein
MLKSVAALDSGAGRRRGNEREETMHIVHVDTIIDTALMERARQRERHMAESRAVQAQAERETAPASFWQFVAGVLRCRGSWGAPWRYDVAPPAGAGD